MHRFVHVNVREILSCRASRFCNLHVFAMAGNKGKRAVVDEADGTASGPPPKRAPKKAKAAAAEDAAAPSSPKPKTKPAGKGAASASAKKAPAAAEKDIEDAWEAPSFTEAEIASARASLLDWYDAHHRVLPWRRTPHSKRAAEERAGLGTEAGADLDADAFAYGVWVSEIMLQQTRVATVIPYFTKWLARWPTVASLAGATQEEVNEAWAGLGYYRRARYLLEGSKHVVDKLEGKFPRTADGLKAIPGVGPYTAAAVASIAFGAPSAVVDGNVIRVMARLRAIDRDPKKSQTQKAVSSLASQLLDPSRAGCFNQAVMELGATVCTPDSPSCDSCPVSTICTARAQYTAHVAGGGSVDGAAAPLVTRYPSKTEKAKPREEEVAVCILEVRREGGEAEERQVALLKRPEGGLLAGLWEFPSVILGGAAAEGKEEEEEEDGGEGEGAAGAAAAAAAAGPAGAAAESPESRLDSLLRSEPIGLDVSEAGVVTVSRKKLGDVKHTFSHIRHTYRVEHLVLSLGPDAWGRVVGAERAGLQWVSWAEMGASQQQKMTSGVLKCWELLWKKEEAREKSKKSGILKFFAAAS